MPSVVRPVTYTGTLQRLVITDATAGDISVQMWGGGGGGGGNDRIAGGTGSGAGYAVKQFSVVAGDIIDIAIGGGGSGGASGAGAAPGGSAGASYIVTTQIFNSLTPPAGPAAVYQVTNRAYCGFLNTYGVWGDPGGITASFDRTYTITAPTTGTYQVVSSCDNYGTVYIDGSPVLDVMGYTSTYTVNLTLTAGTHTIRTYGVNIGGPGSMATTVTLVSGADSYSGGFGGSAGGAGSSGGGGGGGGATVLFKNGSIIAVAGGGGGGGGGGNRGAAAGENAPGSAGRATPGTNAGQNGINCGYVYADGGGGGGGGGGYGGGQGGNVGPNYDSGGRAGSAAGNLGDSTAEPIGRNPGTISSYGIAGVGGSITAGGSAGLAVFTFDINGLYVKDSGVWRTVNQVYVKANDAWQPVKDIWIKENNTWKQLPGTNTTAPAFTAVSGNFGIDSRIYPVPEPSPE